MSKQFEVQHYTLCDGWVNTWSTEDEGGTTAPTTFGSFEEALDCLDAFLEDEQMEFEEGNIESPYDREEFRIVEINAVPA